VANLDIMGVGPHRTLASLPDRELVLAFQAGDDDAFEHLYQRHRARVTAICHKMLGNRSDAEEAAQETFLKAFEALPRFNGRFQVGAWLARIATNVCIDHLRRRGRAHLVALPADGDELRVEEGPESAIAGRDPRVRRAIREIQPSHARALMMRNLEGLSHREIGERMAMGPAQVKALLHRARRSLRRVLGKAQGRLVAPLVGLRVAASKGSANAHHSSGHLADQAGGAVSLIGGKVAVVVVAATLSGLPDGDPGYRPSPAPRVSSATPFEVKRGTHASRPQARAGRTPAGERRSATIATENGDLTTTTRRPVAAGAPASKPLDDGGALISSEQRVPAGTSDAPTVLHDARKLIGGDLAGS
jgi:RNA polymerase sigma-70 factor (ECF subfamily)